jgi:hypothetical protein
MNRNYLRVSALALFLYLSVAPVAVARQRDHDVFTGPGERIIRIIKKVRTFFRGISSQEDLPVPPIP